MNNFLKIYTKMSYLKSIIVRFTVIIMVLIVFAVAAFSQETPNPTPTITPVPTPVVSRPAPAPPTDMPNLNDNPLELPDIPPAPPVDTPNYDNSPRPLPAPGRVGVNMDDQTPLALEDAIRLALQNNNDIEIAQSDVKSAEFDFSIAKGVYDPKIVSDSFYRRSTTPSASTLSGSADSSVTESSLNANIGVNGQLPFQGGSYSANFAANRATTDNSFTSLNPQYPSSFNFQYTQPLFRNRKTDSNRRQIDIAKKNLSLTDSQFRQKVTEIIAQVETAYWDLVYAQRNLQVQIEGVKLANEQVSSNERQVEQGVLAPNDVVAARSQVATFEQQVFLAQQAVTQSENNLKNLILPDRNSPIWSNPIVPVTPVSLVAPKIDLQNSLVAALANRPEISQLVATAEINEIDKQFYRDQTKPQVDFVASYTSSGLAGKELQSSGANPFTSGLTPLITRINELSTLNNLPPINIDLGGTGSGIPDNLTGGYFQSLSNLALQKYPTYQVGVKISIPFRNTVAEANLGKSLVAETRIKSQREKMELAIETEVRNALQAVRSQEQRLQAASEARIAADQLYVSEQRKFQSGTSTVFLVLQRQTDLVTARGREVQAQTDLNKAITQFQRSIGTTLDAAGVSFDNREPSYKRPNRTEITTVFGNN